jgi:predicted membrane chloride channel (bestrophin family)
MVYPCGGSFYFFKWQWMVIPWVPVALIGTAEAFYVGFKNNQAYDRLWEARKIWGGIVNSSRSFTSMLYAFNTADESDLELEKKEKISLSPYCMVVYFPGATSCPYRMGTLVLRNTV